MIGLDLHLEHWQLGVAFNFHTLSAELHLGPLTIWTTLRKTQGHP